MSSAIHRCRIGSFAFLLVLCAFVHVVRGADRIEKTALLLIPETVSIQERLPIAVEFRWDEDIPVTLDTWDFSGELETMGDVTVFDENGKEVAVIFPVSLPLIPSGRRTVAKGEILKIGLYRMSSVDFAHAGRYYAIAEFSSAFAGDTNVRFTSKKRWFQVIDAKPKSI